MKAMVPKSWKQLPQAERQRIIDYVQEVALNQVTRDSRIMLDLYIKMVCVVLHDAFGFGEKRLNMFIGNHRLLFKRQMKMVKDDTQIEYLNRRMAEIFKKDGFPSEFFEGLIGKAIEVEVVD